jgi:hypothetical protein
MPYPRSRYNGFGRNGPGCNRRLRERRLWWSRRGHYYAPPPFDLRRAELSGRRAERFECACSVPTTYGSVRGTAERGSSSDVPSRTCYRGGSVLLRPAVNTKACRFYSFPATLRGRQEASGRNARVCGRPAYWRAIAMRIASSGETRWSEFSAASAMASWTPLTRPLKALPREP